MSRALSPTLIVEAGGVLGNVGIEDADAQAKGNRRRLDPHTSPERVWGLRHGMVTNDKGYARCTGYTLGADERHIHRPL